MSEMINSIIREEMRAWLSDESELTTHFDRDREAFSRLAKALDRNTSEPVGSLAGHICQALRRINEARIDDAEDEPSVWFRPQLSEDIGAELVKQLAEVARVRAARRKHYGDTYRSLDLYELYVHSKCKLDRYLQQLEPVQGFRAVVRDDCASVAADSLRDLINYSLFALVHIDEQLNAKMEEAKS